MDENRDFTFWRTDSPEKKDSTETAKDLPDVSAITINDEPSRNLHSSEANGLPWSKQFSQDGISNSRAREFASKEGENTCEITAGKNAATEKFASRAKVPFEKGYSQMDWLRLSRTHPDLAGLKGHSWRRVISMDEVRLRKTEGAMWTVLKGRVYNLYPYMKYHPGGEEMLMKAVGRDCTSLFNKYHAWVNADFLLEKCLVGILDDSVGVRPQS